MREKFDAKCNSEREIMSLSEAELTDLDDLAKHSFDDLMKYTGAFLTDVTILSHGPTAQDTFKRYVEDLFELLEVKVYDEIESIEKCEQFYRAKLDSYVNGGISSEVSPLESQIVFLDRFRKKLKKALGIFNARPHPESLLAIRKVLENELGHGDGIHSYFPKPAGPELKEIREIVSNELDGIRPYFAEGDSAAGKLFVAEELEHEEICKFTIQVFPTGEFRREGEKYKRISRTTKFNPHFASDPALNAVYHEFVESLPILLNDSLRSISLRIEEIRKHVQESKQLFLEKLEPVIKQ